MHISDGRLDALSIGKMARGLFSDISFVPGCKKRGFCSLRRTRGHTVIFSNGLVGVDTRPQCIEKDLNVAAFGEVRRCAASFGLARDFIAVGQTAVHDHA